MIITLKKADFSNNNIGTLTTWSISTSYNNSAVEIISGSIPSSVHRTSNSGIQATLTIKEGYILGAAGVTVTMGGNPVTSGVTVNENTITINISKVTDHVVITIPTQKADAANYTLTINPTPSDASVIINGTATNTMVVVEGDSVSWSVSKTGYITQEGVWTATANETKSITLILDLADAATLSVSASPADAQVICYAKNKLDGGGATTGSGYITVTKATENVTWQVTKDGYISNGGQINKLAENVHKDITLVPFSSGNWTALDTSTFEEVKDYYITAAGKNAGPYNTWKYLLCPITPGKKYRVISTAGQNALLWMFFAEKPQGEAGAVAPLTKSGNVGMTTKIADEVIAPEGAQYLVVNGRISSEDYKPTIERLDD